MKKGLIFVLFALVSIVSYSQISWNAKVGMNMSNFTGDMDTDMKIGFNVGVGMEYQFSDMWSIQPSLMISQKGGKYDEDGETVKFNPMYLEIPVLAAARFAVTDNQNVVVKAGPYFAFGVAGKVKVGDEKGDFFGDGDDIIQLTLPRFAGQVFAVGIQKLALGRLFAVFAVGLFVAVLLLRAGKAQREGGIAAGYKILVHVLRIGILAAAGHIHQHGKGVGIAQLLHHALHAVFHVIQILFRHPELFHQIVHGLDVQFPGTVQTVPLLLHLTILHPLDKDDRRTLLASNTDHSSSLSPLLQKGVEHIKRFIVKTAVHYSVVKHIQVAAGDDHQPPHHAQHEI